MKKDARVPFVAASMIFGTVGWFVRGIALTSGEIALYRAILASLLIGGWLLLTRQKIPFFQIRKDIPALLCSGAAMGVNWILLFEAYKHTSVSLATLSYYAAPVLVTGVCPFLFHEKLTARQIFCFVMSTVGIVLITGVGGGDGHRDTLGILLALGAAVFYATVIILNKLIKGVTGVHRTFLQFLAAIAVLIPYVMQSERAGLMTLSTQGWCMMLIVGLLHTGFTYCLYFSVMGQLTGQEVAILSYIDPLVAVLISALLLNERMMPVQILGGVLILGFTLLNELLPKVEQKK